MSPVPLAYRTVEFSGKEQGDIRGSDELVAALTSAAQYTEVVGNPTPRMRRLMRTQLSLCGKQIISLMTDGDEPHLFVPVWLARAGREQQGCVVMCKERAIFAWTEGAARLTYFATSVPYRSVTHVEEVAGAGDHTYIKVATPDSWLLKVPKLFGMGASVDVIRSLLNLLGSQTEQASTVPSQLAGKTPSLDAQATPTEFEPTQLIRSAAAFACRSKNAEFIQATKTTLAIFERHLAELVYPNDRASLLLPAEFGVSGKTKLGCVLLLEDRAMFAWTVSIIRNSHQIDVVPLSSVVRVVVASRAEGAGTSYTVNVRADGEWTLKFTPQKVKSGGMALHHVVPDVLRGGTTYRWEDPTDPTPTEAMVLGDEARRIRDMDPYQHVASGS
jgi:hypothetical protein